MENKEFLNVYLNETPVGKLALTDKNLTVFEYDKSWIADGFSISPFSLPLEKKVFVPKIDPFNGVFGVFNDSMPDGWGRLLVDRLLAKNSINPFGINQLTRLSIVSEAGMGALNYRPETRFATSSFNHDLDFLAEQSQKILNSEYCENLDDLVSAGGSSGGARPKILTKIDGQDWIIKFTSSPDMVNAGEMEYEYSLAAKDCGIEMPETKLFESKKCSGYFGVKRFDRKENKKVHMVSASGLLETSHRIPNLDYNILMKLTLELTKNYEEIEKLFRIMCFNVFAQNRDDHSKNFSFIYDNGWKLSPAYDLTYSASFNGEHATTVNGEGKNPNKDNLLAVANNIELKNKKAKEIINEIEEKVQVLKRFQIFNV